MKSVNVAIAGVGNCASSLVQGVQYYSQPEPRKGLITPVVGRYAVSSIKFVAAFDVDERKVGKPIDQAIVAPPNSAMSFGDAIQPIDAAVSMGPVLDGIASHITSYPVHARASVASQPPVDVAQVLRKSQTDVLLCYLPVGSTEAVQYYADAALAAGVAFINCVPVFIANNPAYARRFRDAGIPLIGDDIRSQVGATIVHQRLAELLCERGYEVVKSYQLNVGGNADFLNMLDQTRLRDKKKSKTGAVMAKLGSSVTADSIHVGPSDYVPHLGDTKIAFIRAEARGFGGASLSFDLRLEVQDSPNSAGVVVDLIRYAAVARDNGVGGLIDAACSYYMKSPPLRLDDEDARERLSALSRAGLHNAPAATGFVRELAATF